jgi:predicted PurR-regulated permease PerM
MSQYRQYLYWALGLGAIGAIVYYFSDILIWILLAWVVSLLGSPVMNVLARIKIGKKKLSAPIRASFTLLFFMLLFALFISLFVPVIIQQGNNLAKVNYAQVIAGLEEPINHLYKRLDEAGLVEHIPTAADSAQTKKDSLSNSIDSNEIKLNIPLNETNILVKTIQIDSLIKKSGDTSTRTNIQLTISVENPEKENPQALPIADSSAIVMPFDSPMERIQKQIFSYFNPSTFLRSTFSTFISIVGNLFVLITSVLFIAFFFLQEEGMFAKVVKAPFPEKQGDKIDRALYMIKKMLVRYFEGILAQISILTLFLWLLLTVVGVPNALLIAFFGAVVNVIPYIGPFIGMAFGLIVTICSSLDFDFYVQTVPLLVKVIVIFFSMQALDNLLLQPFIFSKSVKAHPVEIFVVIVVGSKMAGMVGMVVAIPFYTALRVIASIFLSEFKIVQQLTAQLNINVHWVKGSRNVLTTPIQRYGNIDRIERSSKWDAQQSGRPKTKA